MQSQDFLALKPNQEIDGDQTECTALTTSIIVGNLFRKTMDPDFTYAYTLKTMGVTPTTGGADPLAAMQSAVIYGTLPASDETFTALSIGELYVANFANYTSAQENFSEVNAQNGIKTLDGYQDILNWLSLNKGGVGIPMLWYPNFMTPNADGTLPEPQGTPSNHMVPCFYADGRGLQVNPLLGADFGQSGYVYISPQLFPQIQQTYTYSYAFDPSAWRWMQLAQIALQHWNIIPDILPILKTTQS